MGDVIQADFLFARLCRDVENWYRRYYFGKDVSDRISFHLMALQEMYEERTFSQNSERRQRQVVEFLTLVQNRVNGG